VFWPQKPSVFVVRSGCWLCPTSSNAVWNCEWKRVRDATDPQVQRTRMNDNDRAVCNWLNSHIQSIITLSLNTILYYIWMFVYFLCFQTPFKLVRRRNLARRPCPGLLLVFVFIGVVVTKKMTFLNKIT